jgi:Tol biopolymer transport system component
LESEYPDYPKRLCVSPDGERFLVTSVGYGGIWWASRENPVFRQVSGYEAWAGCFGPDGDLIVYDSPMEDPQGSRKRRFQLGLKRLSTGQTKRLTNNSYHDFGPVFSTDGKTIYFLRSLKTPRAKLGCDWGIDLFGINLETGRETRLTHQEYPFCSAGPVQVSGDGKWLAFAGGRSDKPSLSKGHPIRIYVYKVGQQSAPQKISGTGINDDFRSPSLSPDGATIAFARSDQDQIWIVNIDGTNPRKMTTSEGSKGSPVFSSDGRRIYFTVSEWGGPVYEVREMDLGTGNEAVVARFPPRETRR